MKRLCALVLIPALIGANCAARGAATAVRTQDPPELWQKYAAKLPVGSVVRIATTDGDRFNATLLIVDDTGVTVKPTTRVPESARHVTFDRLAQLELQSSGSSPGDQVAAVGIGIATGAGVFLGSLFLLFALFAD
jgi:hypothetical protein